MENEESLFDRIQKMAETSSIAYFGENDDSYAAEKYRIGFRDGYWTAKIESTMPTQKCDQKCDSSSDNPDTNLSN